MHIDMMINPTGQHIVLDEARDRKSMCFISETFHHLNIMTHSVRVDAISWPMKGAYIGPP